MPNKYVRISGSQTYKNYTDKILEQAIDEVRQKKLTYREAHDKYGVSTATISRKINKQNLKKHGEQNVLSTSEEKCIVDAILYASDWGFPFEKDDVRNLVKAYLDRAGKSLKPFKNNLPGEIWYKNFIQRHNKVLKSRLGENIKRSRAAVSRKVINEYFDNLEISLSGIPPQNIVNYDETNFVDDPGRIKVLVRKTSKHADNIMDTTKSATSVMFAVDAAGSMLPLYVVYKSTQLWNSWTTGGTENCRYNRSPSGWFDQSIFEDWFITVVIPHFRRIEGKKVVIGDNLASHMSIKIIQMCKENDIKFIFLPPNSTHLTQPLDVSCFRPIKIAWRKVLKSYKKTRRGPIPKEIFPRLLKKTLEKLSISQMSNIKAGFEATGIYPLNRDKVLKRLPDEDLESINSSASIVIPEALHKILKETRFGNTSEKISRRKKYNIQAGCSVTEDAMNIDTEEKKTFKKRNTGKRNEENDETELDNNIVQNIFNDDIIDETEYSIINCKSEKYYTQSDPKTEGEKKTKCDKIIVHDFVKVKFETIKKNIEIFIGQVSEIDGNEYTCKFLRKNNQMTGFYCFPFIIDEATITKDQIIEKMMVKEQRRGNWKFQ